MPFSSTATCSTVPKPISPNHPRWSLISVYNRAENVPYNEPYNSAITPLEPVPDEALLEWQTEELSDEAQFLEKEKDQALK